MSKYERLLWGKSVSLVTHASARFIRQTAADLATLSYVVSVLHQLTEAQPQDKVILFFLSHLYSETVALPFLLSIHLLLTFFLPCMSPAPLITSLTFVLNEMKKMTGMGKTETQE